MRSNRVEPLDADVAERLRNQPLTYAEVGATDGDLPGGYRQLRRDAHIGRGANTFAAAGAALMRWQVQTRAGLRVASSAPDVGVGEVAILTLGSWPVRVISPVRVVATVQNAERIGFTYGTLPGHQESGEERFEVRLRDNGDVVVSVVAFSRPAGLLARAGGPVGHAVQDLITRRYLAALT